jgi:hypothetical protein
LGIGCPLLESRPGLCEWNKRGQSNDLKEREDAYPIRSGSCALDDLFHVAAAIVRPGRSAEDLLEPRVSPPPSFAKRKGPLSASRWVRKWGLGTLPTLR